MGSVGFAGGEGEGEGDGCIDVDRGEGKICS